ncbi:hypothetical protein IFM89_000093 [Coptis chinensis]|uniref:Uncharacterized protein n=1 Tax=Coptis chinensis TaxID=261450 RepID=A0A835HZQ7_9MAGN|nr:hypothetical protein IFM89_000093 [Coptis chinensis]
MGIQDLLLLGAIFTLGTINGQVSKIAMEAAVNDVNYDPSFLGGSKLNITVHDSNFSGFLSIIGGSLQGVPVNLGICGLYIVCCNVLGVPRWLTSEKWLSNFVDECLSPLHLLSASSLMYKREIECCLIQGMRLSM